MPTPGLAGADVTVPDVRVDVVRRGPQLPPGDWSRLVSSLPAADRGRLEGMRRWQDRQASALGWQLLHRLARERGATVRRSDSGRPRCDPPFDMTLTHAGGWVATAVSRTGRVGIDVEAVRDVSPSLARRCLSGVELDWLDGASGPADRNHRFCRLWTAKEAYLKALGVGLAVDPREVVVDLRGDRPSLGVPASETWELWELAPATGVCLTVCAEQPA